MIVEWSIPTDRQSFSHLDQIHPVYRPVDISMNQNLFVMSSSVKQLLKQFISQHNVISQVVFIRVVITRVGIKSCWNCQAVNVALLQLDCNFTHKPPARLFQLAAGLINLAYLNILSRT